MIRTGYSRGRGARFLRDLAPIAAAAGAAAMTVTLVVGPTTARIRTSTGEESEIALAVDDAARRTGPRGDVTVRVRPRPPAPLAIPAAVFDLVSSPASSAAASAAPVFFVSARPQLPSTAPIRGPELSVVAPVPPATLPPPSVLSVVPPPTVAPPAPTAAPTGPNSAPPAPGVSSADAPRKRPGKPLRPAKDRTHPVSGWASARASENAEARADRPDRTDAPAADQASDKADAPSDDKSAARSDDKKVDKSKQ